MKYNSIYNNFGSGELSRNLFGRTDLQEYFKGVAEMTNFIPTRQGGASFRPGTISVESGFQITAAKTVNFSPREDENYVVILTPGSPIQVLFSDGEAATITQRSYIWNSRIDFTDSTDAYNLPLDDDNHRLICDSLQVACSGDVMIIVDGTGILAPIALLRVAENTFIVDSLIFPDQLNDLGTLYLNLPTWHMRVPYTDPNIDTNIRLVASATTGSVTISAQDAATDPVDFFTGDVVGMYVRISNGTTEGVALISAKISDSSVTATVLYNFGDTSPQTDFQTSAWNPVNGYPRSVCFHEGRLIFGGNDKFPDMIWCSLTGNIYHFMQRRFVQDESTDMSGYNFFGAVKSTDPFNFIPASVSANNIQWLYSADSLLVGTTGTEFSITGGQEQSISVSSIFIKAISGHGSSKVQPLKVGSSLLFVSKDGKRVLEIPKRLNEYTSATDWTGLASGIVEKSIESVSSDLNSLLSIDSKITTLAWDESTGVLWCVSKNIDSSLSTLISLTVDTTTKVVAWAKHKIAGDPFISSVASVSDKNHKGNSRVYIYLRRDGATYYSLESISYKIMHDSFQISRVTPGAGPLTIYLDGAAFAGTVEGNPDELLLMNANKFASGSSFGVIEIEDGVGTYIGEFTDDGSGVLAVPGVDPEDPSKTYLTGSLYEGLIKTMPIEAGAQFGVSQGSLRRGHELSVYVDRSVSGTYKASKSSNEFSIVGSKGSPESLYTGEIKLSLNASPDDPQIVLKQSEPYPLTILWLLTKGYTYDA